MIYMFWGEYLGCGKTAGSVWLAERMMRRRGLDVYGNFKMKFMKGEPIAGEPLLIKKIPNCVKVIDELYAILEARGSGQGENQVSTDSVLMTRKRWNELIGTSPDPTYVDKRFRDMTDFFIECQRFGKLWDLNARIKMTWECRNRKSVTGWEKFDKWFRVSDVAGLYDTDEEIERDRFAYADGISDCVIVGFI